MRLHQSLASMKTFRPGIGAFQILKVASCSLPGDHKAAPWASARDETGAGSIALSKQYRMRGAVHFGRLFYSSCAATPVTTSSWTGRHYLPPQQHWKGLHNFAAM